MPLVPYPGSSLYEDGVHVLFVLGMHRSGTSCVTGLLEDAGFKSGATQGWLPDNAKGNRERGAVNALNDLVLTGNGARWDKPPTTRQIEAPADALTQRDTLVNALHAEDQQRPVVIKDPRTLLSLPFWEQAVPDASFMGIFRHPWSVACSIATRDMGQTLEDGLKLWIDYNARLLEGLERSKFPLICFDLPRQQVIDQVRAAIRLTCNGLVEQGSISPDAVGDFYAEDLVHQDATSEPDWQSAGCAPSLLGDALALYDKLCKAAGMGEAPLAGAAGWNGFVQRLQQADALRQDGDWTGALAAYEALLSHAKDRGALWRRMIKLCRGQGWADQFLALVRAAAMDCPADPDFPVQWGEHLEKQGDLPGAAQAFALAVERRDDWWLAHLRLGACLNRQRRWAEALPHLQRARTLNPEYHWVEVPLFVACLGTQDEAGALRHFASACRQHPADKQALIVQSWVGALVAMNRKPEALAALQEAQAAGIASDALRQLLQKLAPAA